MLTFILIYLVIALIWAGVMSMLSVFQGDKSTLRQLVPVGLSWPYSVFVIVRNACKN